MTTISKQTSNGLSCIPSYWEWDDQRQYKGTCLLKASYGKVINKSNDEVYGSDTINDANSALRVKFIFIIVLSVPLTPVRFFLRCVFFLPLGVLEGRHRAQLEWKNRCVQWYIGKESVFPTKLTLISIYVTHILKMVAENFVKTATNPLCMVLLVFSALYGLLKPLDGRRLIHLVEKFWNIQLPKPYPQISVARKTFGVFARTINFVATCMQSRKSRKEFEYFRLRPDYNEKTLRSLLAKLEESLSDPLLKISPAPINGLKEIISDYWWAHVRHFSEHDFKETDEKGVIQSSNLDDIRNALASLCTELEELIKTDEAIIESAMQSKIPQGKQVIWQVLVPSEKVHAAIKQVADRWVELYETSRD